jgi:hypothetical protein
LAYPEGLSLFQGRECHVQIGVNLPACRNSSAGRKPNFTPGTPRSKLTPGGFAPLPQESELQYFIRTPDNTGFSAEILSAKARNVSSCDGFFMDDAKLDGWKTDVAIPSSQTRFFVASGNDRKWLVYREGVMNPIDNFRRKLDAVEHAKLLAQQQPPSEVLVEQRDGTFKMQFACQTTQWSIAPSRRLRIR